jgi:predicted DNA-binding transcriptional regulator YafY
LRLAPNAVRIGPHFQKLAEWKAHAMYHPTTRVLTVLELLQTYGQLSSAELARRLEVTPRSVRRYIMMLQDLGIPIESERGRHGGYRLRPGYKLPPLMFTNNEAMAVTLGLLNVDRLGLVVDEPAIEGALAKIGRVLPDSVQDQVRSIQEATFIDDVPGKNQTAADTIIKLSQAVQQQRQIWIRYITSHRESTRTIDPYGLILRDGAWYVVGWCHLRVAIRVFRLDRISTFRVLSRRFTRPAEFDARETVLKLLSQRFEVPQVELLLDTTIDEAREWISIVSATLHQEPDGVVMTCDTSSLEWLAMFVLSMPWKVTVRKPVELMDALRSLSARMAAISYELATSEREGVPARER